MDFTKLDNSPAALEAFLASEQLAPKKRWGQNFMVSPGARQNVVDALDSHVSDTVWEIGPGIGSITNLLVDRSRALTVFEIDHGLIEVLRRRFGESVLIVSGDAVKTMRDRLRAGAPDLIVGNLPYRSAAAIVAVVFESGAGSGGCRRLVFTVQREMARRMVAGPGTKNYSAFSVLCSLSGKVDHVADLAAGSFYPAPGVVSSLITIDLKRVDPKRLVLAGLCCRSLFASRRKTIRNNLHVLSAALEIPIADLAITVAQAGIDPGLRAERLQPEVYLRLAELIERNYSGRT